MTQKEITVHDFTGISSIEDGDVINLGNGNVAILVQARPTVVVGEIEHFYRLEAGLTLELLDGGKYAASAAKAREVSNAELKRQNEPRSRDPNQVYETGSDDTFWNAKVVLDVDRFNVQVYDADGDRRSDREDSFVDRALAIAFADRSVCR